MCSRLYTHRAMHVFYPLPLKNHEKLGPAPSYSEHTVHFSSFNTACRDTESMQSEETAPVVRQTDIRRLVIKIGSYTNKNTHTCKVYKHTHTYTHTNECADVFSQSIFAHTYTYKCEHIKDENTPS